MTDLKHLNPTQRRHFHYMSDVMRRLEWDLHNTIELTDRIPEEWHEIAQETPEADLLKVNLRLEADVVKFFKTMGSGYGARMNAVLKSYMHARIAGVIHGAETINHFKRREGRNDEEKPGFGHTARSLGEEYEDDTPMRVKMKALLKEKRQSRAVEEGLEGDAGAWPRVR